MNAAVVDAASPVVVLAVCTGNLCRSPVAERLLAARLAPIDPDGLVTVGSAGVEAVVGQPISTTMVELLTAVGASAEEFSARQLTRELVESADLLLTATRQHRQDVVQLAPGALRRTFTLRELARLGSLLEFGRAPAELSARLRWLVRNAPLMRGRVVTELDADDIPDPYGRDAAAYQLAYDQIDRAVVDIVGMLSPLPIPQD